MIIYFTKSIYLLLLALVPLVILIHFFTLKRKNSRAIKFANFEAIARISGIDILSKNLLVLILTVIIIFLISFSLAGMNLQQQFDSSDASFVLAIDSSESMSAVDFFPTRLDVAKDSALDFIDSTSIGTRIGVVSFSGSTYIESHVTEDKISVKQSIREILLSTIGGTDLYEAVITGSNLLRGEDGKVIVLLSDGRINIGTIIDTIRYANENDVIVHAIAMGTEEGGLTSYGLSELDVDSLKSVSYNTGGQFFQAESDSDLQFAFSEIVDLKLKNISIDIGNYLLILALILFVIEYFLINTRYRGLP